MNDDATIRTIIAEECELESMADSIVAALAFHGYRIVPTELEDWRRTQFKPIPVPPGYVHTEHGLAPDPCAGGCTHDHDHTAGGSLPFCSNCPDCLLIGGSTETAARHPDDNAQEQLAPSAPPGEIG